MTRCVSIAAIAVVYASYLVFSPNPEDGVVFGTVMAVIAGLAGYDLATKRAAK